MEGKPDEMPPRNSPGLPFPSPRSSGSPELRQSVASSTATMLGFAHLHRFVASRAARDWSDNSRIWAGPTGFSTARSALPKKLAAKRKKSVFPLAEQPEPDYKGATPQAHAPFV
ncbi:hypothetical protein, partial [Agrobacterium pusense]